MKEEQFISNLRVELQAAQNSRSQYIRQKFMFVSALFGVGSISVITKSQEFQAMELLYVVPIISVAFDLYILGEDFSVKRIGAFLGRKHSSTCDEEKKWETYVAENRDLFSVLAGPLMSVLVLILSACLLWSNLPTGFLYYLWLVFIVFSIGYIHVHGYRLRKKLRKSLISHSKASQ